MYKVEAFRRRADAAVTLLVNVLIWLVTRAVFFFRFAKILKEP